MNLHLFYFIIILGFFQLIVGKQECLNFIVVYFIISKTSEIICIFWNFYSANSMFFFFADMTENSLWKYLHINYKLEKYVQIF